MSKAVYVERLICKKVSQMHDEDYGDDYAYHIYDDHFSDMIWSDDDMLEEPMLSIFHLFQNHSSTFHDEMKEQGFDFDNQWFDPSEIVAISELADLFNEHPDKELFTEEFFDGNISEWQEPDYIPILAKYFHEYFDVWFNDNEVLAEHESVLKQYCPEHEDRWKPAIIIKKAMSD